MNIEFIFFPFFVMNLFEKIINSDVNFDREKVDEFIHFLCVWDNENLYSLNKVLPKKVLTDYTAFIK